MQKRQNTQREVDRLMDAARKADVLEQKRSLAAQALVTATKARIAVSGRAPGQELIMGLFEAGRRMSGGMSDADIAEASVIGDLAYRRLMFDD